MIITTIIIYSISCLAYFAYLVLQKDHLYKAGFVSLIFGYFFHSLILYQAYVSTGHIPIHNLYETLLIADWAIACIFILFQLKFHIKILGSYAAPLITIILIITLFLPKHTVEIKYITNNLWLILHIFMVFTGEAAFALACGIGILYIIQEKAIKGKHHGFFYKRLPSLELLDSAGYVCIITGFILLTVGLIAGYAYAKIVWEKYITWDPKELWSSITWLAYAVLLFIRFVLGWKGQRAAIMAIVGFLALIFTFLGANFLLKGHHMEFTKFLY